MSLPTFPPEVLQHCLFPFLRWNDLLRFRRVSRGSKLLVQNHVKANPEVAPMIRINNDDDDEITEWNQRNVKAFLDMGLVSTKIHLNIEGSRSDFYYENAAELTRFLNLYGSIVTHLSMNCFSLNVSEMERTFLDGFINLQSFEVLWLDIAEDSNAALPQVLRNITVLKLSYHGDGRLLGRFDDSVINGFIRLVKHCKMVEILHPLGVTRGFSRPFATQLFEFLDAAIKQRETNPNNATLSKLKFIDLEYNSHWIDRPTVATTFGQFLTSCAKHGILLRGLHADGNVCLQEFARNIGNLKMPLQSFCTISDTPYNWIWLVETEMPFLEGIMLQSNIPEGIRRVDNTAVNRNANWPMLKNLDLDIEVLSGKKGKGCSQKILKEKGELCKFFFEGTCYTKLSELRVEFRGKVGNDKLTAEQLTNSCPNLKKLTLNNWGGNNEQFVRLWEGLANLEEVVLECCSKLGDEGFIGPDAEKPVFLNLKKLRKLTLQSLSKMPGITDHLFIMVIRHLSLTHFKITSEDPIKKVTANGIESLSGGRFEECIEKFSLEDWTLQSATPRENRKLQKLFTHRFSNLL